MFLENSLERKSVLEREENVTYHIDHQANHFLMLHKSPKTFTLYKISDDDSKISLEKAQTLINFDPDEYIEDMEVFKNYIVLFMTRNSFSLMKYHDMLTNTTHEVKFHGSFGNFRCGNNLVFKSNHLK